MWRRSTPTGNLSLTNQRVLRDGIFSKSLENLSYAHFRPAVGGFEGNIESIEKRRADQTVRNVKDTV